MHTCWVLYAVIYLFCIYGQQMLANGRSLLSTSDSEINALNQFFRATGGDLWAHKNGWLSGDPCDNHWFGVNCSTTTGSVSELHLTQNNLFGTWPSDALAALAGLEVLDISYNSFSGPIPSSAFSNLPLLREIYVNNNQFNGTLDFFDSLPSTMEVLYIPENSFSGTLPASIGRFTMVNNFQMFSNDLSGTIPKEIGDMVSLQSLDFGFNNFVGNLPAEIGNLINLENFWLYDDEFSGTLPDTLGNLKNLQLLEVTRNQFEGEVPQSFANLTSLQILRLGGNNFTGTPTAMCSLLNLTEVLLYSNQFTGVPPCNNNKQLSMLYMSDNKITGNVPQELGDLTALKRIDLSHNQITGTVPASFSKLVELILLDFSHNDIGGTLSDMLLPLARLDRVTSVDVSYNRINGSIPYNLVWDDATQEELSKSVTYLYINNNNLTGDIPDYLSWMYRLEYVDLSNNGFTGPIPESLSYLKTLHIQGNPEMFGVDGGNLPSFLVPDYSNVKKSGNFSCPGLKGKDVEYVIEIDSSYFNYSYCSCDRSFYGVNGTCTACPAHADCPGGGMEIHVEAGYFPLPDKITPVYMLTCSKDNFGFTPCNPNGSYPFECKKGYEGRMCSKCSAGYFSRGIECAKCLSTGKKATVIVFVVLVVIAIYTFFIVTKPVASLPSAARKTGMFYFQALNLLLTRFAGWPFVFSFLATISSAFNFGFNYTCVIFDFFDIYYVTLAIPFFSVTLNAILIGSLYFVRYVYSQRIDLERWINGAMRTVILTLNFMYLPLCTLILSMFVCIEDTYSHDKYLAVAPWIQCNGNSRYTAAVSVAAFFFVIYILGIPGLFAYTLYRHKHRLEQHGIIAAIGSLYVDYTERTYYFELVGLFRRFVFALVIAVVKQDNLFLISSILFFVLVAYALITIRFKPFNYRLSNLIEILAMGVLTFNLVGILAATSLSTITSTSATQLATSDEQDVGHAEAVVMQVFLLLANLAYIVVLLGALCFGVSHMFLPENLRSSMESVRSLRYLSKVQTRAFELPKTTSVDKKVRLTPTIVVNAMDESTPSTSASPSTAPPTHPLATTASFTVTELPSPISETAATLTDPPLAHSSSESISRPLSYPLSHSSSDSIPPSSNAREGEEKDKEKDKET